jgi:hypothetical protein
VARVGGNLQVLANFTQYCPPSHARTLFWNWTKAVSCSKPSSFMYLFENPFNCSFMFVYLHTYFTYFRVSFQWICKTFFLFHLSPRGFSSTINIQ